MRYTRQVAPLELKELSSFQTFWQKLANEFKSNSKVVFDLMNEPHDIAATAAASLMQGGINGVRASGATNTIMVEGTSWTGAWSEFFTYPTMNTV